MERSNWSRMDFNRGRDFARNKSFASGRGAVGLAVVLLFSALTLFGCQFSGDGGGGGGGPACQAFVARACPCAISTGIQTCSADGSGFGECQCPFQKATVAPWVVQTDGVAPKEAKAIGNSLVMPAEGNTVFMGLLPGEYLLSWDAGIMGQVTDVVVNGNTLEIKTTPCALTDVFEELEFHLHSNVPILPNLPPGVGTGSTIQPPTMAQIPVTENGEMKSLEPLAPVSAQGVPAKVKGPAGTEIGIKGKLDIGVEFIQPSHFDLNADIDADISIGFFTLNEFKFIASLGVDAQVKSRLTVDAEVEVWAEIELIEAALTAAGYGELAPLRVPITGPLELEITIPIGCKLEMDAQVNVESTFIFKADASGGIYYDKDFEDPKWRTVGSSELEKSFTLDDFDFAAHGLFQCYLKPKLALTVFRCGGPTLAAGPYVGVEAWVGMDNKLQVKAGFNGSVGGKIEILGEYTLWEEEWDLFDYYWVLWEKHWSICGDGWRQNTSNINEEDREECDVGIWNYKQHEMFDGAEPCIPAGQPGACTCGTGYVPDIYNGATYEDLGKWGTGTNWCVPTCGNGVVEPEEEEVCDDGNRWTGDACVADCSRLYCVCGDGIKDCWEKCDDGNRNNGDGCDGSCWSLEVCGNDIVDYAAGEVCDDGNTLDGDNCSHDCKSREQCGDGILNPVKGEECDDGDLDDCDGCSSKCKIITDNNFCGDGVWCGQASDGCDDGNSDDCDRCHNDCTWNIGCGDGHICGIEQCDNGNWNGLCSDCDAYCMIKSGVGCGDGVVCSILGEECDDGNQNDCDGCMNNCHIGYNFCGDGVKRCDEQCDDGNSTAGDGCSPVCKLEVCGNKILDSKIGEVCDDGNTVDGDGCSKNCRSNETCANNILDPAAGEVCDDGNRLGGDGCRPDCKGFEICGDGLLDSGEGCEDTTVGGRDLGCFPGYPDCLAPCHGCIGRCGDGFQTPTEDCEQTPDPIDPGCTLATPICNSSCNGCRPDCSTVKCGDFQVCPPETCDDGNTVSSDGCSSNCLSNETCGNGVMDTNKAEACDDGNVNGGDGCRGDCLGLEACGDGLYDPLAGELCDNTSPQGLDAGCIAGFPNCDALCLCQAHKCGDGVLGPGETCDDGDNDNCTIGCNSDCTRILDPVPVCGNSILECGEICDDGNTVDCDGCRADCSAVEFGCGDGFLCGAEVCDDGNTVSADGCRDDCRSDETCGNLLLDLDAGEACDDGDTVFCSGVCNENCSDFYTDVCGDAAVTTCELCEDTDPANASVDSGCNAGAPNCNNCNACSADVCGDGITGPSEGCDYGGICNDAMEMPCTTLDLSLCTAPTPVCNTFVYSINPAQGEYCATDCTHVLCGDSIAYPGIEACDDGNIADCDTCVNLCTLPNPIPGCGDGLLCGIEVCDEGIWNGPAGGDCCALDCLSRPLCGDGTQDWCEQCDDNNTLPGDGCSPTCRTE